MVAAPLSVPAVFVREVGMPGQGEGILRPSALVFDAVHGELLVADPGHSRIVIFSASGSFRYAFGLGDSLTVPRDVVVDTAGFIHVLGSSRNGPRLMTYDFDGLPLGTTPIPDTTGEREVRLERLACDGSGGLYGLDSAGLRILDITRNWQTAVDLAPQVAGNEAGVLGLGRLTWQEGEFLIPVATSGFVLRYATDGTFLGTVGHAGSKPGALAFPVAAARVGADRYLVLDTNRFCIVTYAADGSFLGEFGGKGLSPGWFINPSLLAVNSPGTAVVGQIYANRIQIIELPDFVRTNPFDAGLSIDPGTAVGGYRAAVSNPRRSLQSPENLSAGGSHAGNRILARVSSSEAST